MYLYGISRFLLGRGDRVEAGRYFDTIDWCVRYIKSRICENGTVTSDSDEMEGRIASGNTNLLTNSLSYGGLVCASYLARDLGYPDKASEYSKTAEGLRKAIERVFGGQVEGYDTYMYFPGCDHVRAYSSSPLTVGIFDRAEETAKALIEKLCTDRIALSYKKWLRIRSRTFRICEMQGLQVIIRVSIVPQSVKCTEKKKIS